MNILHKSILLVSLVAYSASAPVNAIESKQINTSESKKAQAQKKRRRIKQALLAAAGITAGVALWRYTGKKPESAPANHITRTRPSPQAPLPQPPLPPAHSIAPKSEATFEHYFSDYLRPESSFAYDKTNKLLPTRSLAYIIGHLSEDGKLSGHMSFAEAEDAHDWVQCAFPTQTVSKFHKSLESTAEFQKKMKESPELRNTLLLCFRYYLNFMGLDLPPTCDLNTKKDDISFVKTNRFEEGIQNFLTHSHNNMRISRILESLRIHGLEDYAQAFSGFLTTPEGIEKMKPGFINKTHTSQGFWK